MHEPPDFMIKIPQCWSHYTMPQILQLTDVGDTQAGKVVCEFIYFLFFPLGSALSFTVCMCVPFTMMLTLSVSLRPFNSQDLC